MSDRPSPGSVSQYSSTDASSEAASGFRTFWRKSDKKDAQQNVTFVQQDPSSKKKTSRFSHLLRQGKQEDDDHPSAKAEAQKRREQVYKAQKRHRNRKTEYVTSLEAEVARLQHLDSVVNSEKNALQQQNDEIRKLLASQPVDVQLEMINLNSAAFPLPGEGTIPFGNMAVDVRYDPAIGHDRTFLDIDMEDIVYTSPSVSQSEGTVGRKHPSRHDPVKGDSWAALDFVLALEWPCQGHVHHDGINPLVAAAAVPVSDEPHCHAFTVTSAVYNSCLPPPATSRGHAQLLANPTTGTQASKSDNKWQLPHSEIDKLIALSDQLQLDDDQLTPAQAYSAIRETVPSEEWLRPALENLKVPLSAMASCAVFGTVLPADMFWQQVDTTLQILQLARSDEGHS